MSITIRDSALEVRADSPEVPFNRSDIPGRIAWKLPNTLVSRFYNQKALGLREDKHSMCRKDAGETRTPSSPLQISQGLDLQNQEDMTRSLLGKGGLEELP